jgi:hypothetical protein
MSSHKHAICCAVYVGRDTVLLLCLQAALAVAQQIVLFCAQHSVQLVVEELMAECAQLISDDGSSLDGGATRRASERPLEDVPVFQLDVRHLCQFPETCNRIVCPFHVLVNHATRQSATSAQSTCTCHGVSIINMYVKLGCVCSRCQQTHCPTLTQPRQWRQPTAAH